MSLSILHCLLYYLPHHRFPKPSLWQAHRDPRDSYFRKCKSAHCVDCKDRRNLFCDSLCVVPGPSPVASIFHQIAARRHPRGDGHAFLGHAARHNVDPFSRNAIIFAVITGYLDFDCCCYIVALHHCIRSSGTAAIKIWELEDPNSERACQDLLVQCSLYAKHMCFSNKSQR